MGGVFAMVRCCCFCGCYNIVSRFRVLPLVVLRLTGVDVDFDLVVI